MPVRHVLVVDDSKSARLMLRKMLQGFGLTVDTVDSAEEALLYLRTQRPDAIFMDHTMPGADGLSAAREIKRAPSTALIPITMYTSKDEASYQDEAREAGAVGVLVKPATPEALGAALEEMSALFDAAAAQALSSPQPTPEPVVTGPAPSMEQMEKIAEKIALEKAEQVIYDAIESQVLPLVNDVIAKLRRDFESSQEEICSRIATRVCEAGLAKWEPPSPDSRDVRAALEAVTRSQWIPLLEERLEAFQRAERAENDRRAREAALQIFQEQTTPLAGRLLEQSRAMVAEATQKADVTAREVALETSQQTVLQAFAEASSGSGASAQGAAGEEAFQRLWASAKQDLQQQAYRAAGWAAVVGIGAALLAYWAR